MSTVFVELPVAGVEPGILAWLRGRQGAEQPSVAVRAGAAAAIGIGVADVDGFEQLLLAAPVPALDESIGTASLQIAPGLSLQPAATGRLGAFLREHWVGFNHLGINLSHRELDDATWRAFVDKLGAAVPAWRLQVGSDNDIVFVVIEGAGGDADAVSVIEFVYDRAAAQSTVHFCVRVAAGRDAVEREFAAPCGGYKPGDEAFFRSVALPSSPAMPVYVDFAFSEAQVAPWPQTVRAIGQRIE